MSFPAALFRSRPGLTRQHTDLQLFSTPVKTAVITVKNQLHRLIKSLSKSEKRSFKLYSRRTGGNDRTPKFVLLFEAIDRRPDAEDAELIELAGLKNEGQLSNLKRNLHRQIMSSLRLIYAAKHYDIEIREQIDFARILYGKAPVPGRAAHPGKGEGQGRGTQPGFAAPGDHRVSETDRGPPRDPLAAGEVQAGRTNRAVLEPQPRDAAGGGAV